VEQGVHTIQEAIRDGIISTGIGAAFGKMAGAAFDAAKGAKDLTNAFTARPEIEVKQHALSFTQRVTGSATGLSIQVQNGAPPGGLPLNFATSIQFADTKIPPWLRDNINIGSIKPDGSGMDMLSTLNYGSSPPGPIPAGLYAATLTVADPNALNSPIKIPVSLTVTGGPTMTVQPAKLTYLATQDGPAPPAQSLTVSNTGSPGSTLNPNISADAGWLLVTGPGTSIAAGASNSYNVTADATGLGPGTYQGTITVADANSETLPQHVGVTLTVGPKPPPVTPSVTITSAIAKIIHGYSFDPNLFNVQIVAMGSATGSVGSVLQLSEYIEGANKLTSDWKDISTIDIPECTRRLADAATTNWTFTSATMDVRYSQGKPQVAAFVATLTDADTGNTLQKSLAVS
jgi:hypothetical protein